MVRLDPRVNHQRAQPQCFFSVNESMPSMSAAGSERMNVTQMKFRKLCATNSLSSTMTMSGNARIGWSFEIEPQNLAISPPAIW